jgi:hypothetical protein
MDDWPFDDPKNVAVYTCRQIVHGKDWIYYVTHDADDGAWQFHTSDPNAVKEEDARLVSLHSIVELDPTVLELSDLPLGWCAWRDNPKAPWKKKKR